MMDDILEHLNSYGWAWLSSLDVAKDLCHAMYSTSELELVRMTIAKPVDETALCVLGNPLEGMVMHNWMGTVPQFCQRIWWMPMETDQHVSILRDSHRPEVVHQVLLRTGCRGFVWDAGPDRSVHRHSPIRLGPRMYTTMNTVRCREEEVQVQCRSKTGSVVLDRLFLHMRLFLEYTHAFPAELSHFWCLDSLAASVLVEGINGDKVGDKVGGCMFAWALLPMVGPTSGIAPPYHHVHSQRCGSVA